MIKFKNEIARKCIHLSSLWIPILYLYLDKASMLAILIPLSILAFLVDFSRRYIPALSKVINMILGDMMRDEEKNKFALSGATYLLFAANISIYSFAKEVAIFALFILMISDSFAALIGRKFGKIKIFGKSLEGSLSFVASALAIYCFLQIFYNFNLPFFVSVLAIIVGSIAELLAKKLHIDDNFAIPLAIGVVFYL